MPVKNCTTCLHSTNGGRERPCAACGNWTLWEPIPAAATPKIDVTISLSQAALEAGRKIVHPWITNSPATAEFVQATYAALNKALESVSQPLPSPIIPGYYKTCNGQLARVFMRDHSSKSRQPVIGARRNDSRAWIATAWDLGGHTSFTPGWDLIEYLPSYKEDE